MVFSDIETVFHANGKYNTLNRSTCNWMVCTGGIDEIVDAQKSFMQEHNISISPGDL